MQSKLSDHLSDHFTHNAVNCPLQKFSDDIAILAATSDLSSQRTQRNSWSKRCSSPAQTTTTPSWLDNQPLRPHCCSVSRTLPHTLFTIYPPPPVAVRIRFKTMVLAFKAFKAFNGTAPVYLQTLVRPHTPARALLLCFGASVVERTPDQCQDSGITLHLPQKTNLFRLHFDPA